MVHRFRNSTHKQMSSSSSMFGSSRGFAGGRGRGTYRGGRGGRGNPPMKGNYDGNNYMETPQYEVCKFHVRNGSCRNGDGCRFSHNLLSVAFAVSAHAQPIHSLGVLNTAGVPKILTGSSDKTVKLWNLGTNVPSEEGAIATRGKVTHVEVNGSTIMWAVDEPMNAEQSDDQLFVGVIHLLNPSDNTTFPIKRSDETPYTHSFGEIRSFTIAVIENTSYVISAGGEGLIKIWRYDVSSSRFEQLGVLEGHVRAVSCLLLNDKFLWSGSLDRTIRVWDIASNKCVGVLSSSTNGHTAAVTSLCYLTGENYIVSGGADCDIKLWRPNGEFVHSCTHASCVTALCPFQDSLGGIQVLLVGLSDGSIVIRSAQSMSLMIVLDSTIFSSKPIWSIVSLGKSCFAVGGEDGQLIGWKIDSPLHEKKS